MPSQGWKLNFSPNQWANHQFGLLGYYFFDNFKIMAELTFSRFLPGNRSEPEKTIFSVSKSHIESNLIIITNLMPKWKNTLFFYSPIALDSLTDLLSKMNVLLRDRTIRSTVILTGCESGNRPPSCPIFKVVICSHKRVIYTTSVYECLWQTQSTKCSRCSQTTLCSRTRWWLHYRSLASN